MEILDKTIPTEWAHDAVARATQVLEPLAEPIKNSGLLNNGLMGHHRPSSMGRLRRAAGAHPVAIGATVVVLGAIAYMALRGSGSDPANETAATGPQRVRSAA